MENKSPGAEFPFIFRAKIGLQQPTMEIILFF